MVDEAHATGVFGKHGRGAVEHLGSVPFFGSEKKGTDPVAPQTPQNWDGPLLHDRVHIRVGTLSKALGSGGGFVCGRQTLIDWLANRARTYVFSTAQPAATSAAASAALNIVRDEPHRRQQLLAAAADLRTRLSEQGWNTAQSASQIIPLVIGDAARTMQLGARLRSAGFFIPGIRPPSVPAGESLLRLSLCYHHTTALVDSLLEQLARLR